MKSSSTVRDMLQNLLLFIGIADVQYVSLETFAVATALATLRTIVVIHHQYNQHEGGEHKFPGRLRTCLASAYILDPH